MTTLRQCDPRWKNKKLGNSTLCNIGCTCTCLAMLANTTPDKIVDEADFTKYGAIYWQSLQSLKFIWRGYKYENDRVAEAIKKYGGCLVEVSMPQASGGKHWVLYIGNRQMNDPITGKTESTSKYTPTGYCILEPLQTNNEPMSDPLKECLAQHTRLVDELTEYKKELADQKTEYAKVLKNINTCQREKSELEFNLKEVEKHYKECSKYYKECSINLSQLQTKHAEALDDINDTFNNPQEIPTVESIKNAISSLKGIITKKENEISELKEINKAIDCLFRKTLLGVLTKIIITIKGLFK